MITLLGSVILAYQNNEFNSRSSNIIILDNICTRNMFAHKSYSANLIKTLSLDSLMVEKYLQLELEMRGSRRIASGFRR